MKKKYKQAKLQLLAAQVTSLEPVTNFDELSNS